MISKCSLTTLLLIISAVSFGQKQAGQVEGVWKTQDQKDSLLVSASGQSNPAVFVYFPNKAKFLPFTISGEELVHFQPDASKMSLSISADGKTITDANGGSKKVFSKVSSLSPVNYKTVAPGPDDFFDYSTSNYYAGINFYLSSHPGLPFMPNPAFVSKKKAKEIKIEKYFARVGSGGSVSVQKEYDLVYNFNSAGQITTVQVIPYGGGGGQETDTWTYAYNGDKIQKISSPGRVLQFDNDNWEVDARQQKKVPFIFPMWDYYSSARPRTATLPYMTGAPLNEYFYDGTNQLVKICSKDVSEPNILEHCTEYSYDKNGLPVKIVETKRSK